MYTVIEKAREHNIKFCPKRMSAEEKKKIVANFHPDNNSSAFRKIRLGQNEGEIAPLELCDLLEGKSIIEEKEINLSEIKHTCDVLIIGGGGAGVAAAIEADKNGADVILATKQRLGDSNTITANGGIQAAISKDDSPYQHFLDSYGGGGFTSQKELLKTLVTQGPDVIDWLCELGVEFDRDKEGNLTTALGGGTSRKRMLSCKDYTGSEIMRTLRDEFLNKRIKLLEHSPAVELLLSENGSVCGAIVMDTDSGEFSAISAKTVIIATGGAGKLHYQDFPTSNYNGTTADGLVLCYRAGGKLIDPKSLQYHPTGIAFPSSLSGTLFTEKARSLGAKLVNKNGEVFVHPLETRDVLTSSILRECYERNNGVVIENKKAVWLDTPMIEEINGKGTIEKEIPAMLNIFLKFGIDIRFKPILVFPTLHYQNGGIEITADTSVKNVKNLFAVGEVAGGIHGNNRLMGNSLLDILVFGRIAGQNAAKTAKKTKFSKPILNHITEFADKRKALKIKTKITSPILFQD